MLNTESRRDIKHSSPLFIWCIRLAIILGLLLISYKSLTGGVFEPIYYAIKSAHWSNIIIRPSLLWIIMGIVLLTFRTILWFLYRPFPSADFDHAPFLTVIVPAYNEGSMVEKTIDSIVEADYPRDRLEIIAIDDGSRDDTWQYIDSASKKHQGLVSAVSFPENRGKRAALEEGFRRARGEIVVTIDSDSVIEKDTLLAITGPFKNHKVGAVAGKVAVYNRYQGLIPRMLHVRFILSFDFLRATQSTYGTVYCCPGALSAYRVTVVRKVLEAWMNQSFLGKQCTYGEDRALTNLILAQGFNSVYQRTAVVHTIVPWTYEKLCKMYLRWDRSYIREEIIFAGIVWKRPLGARIIAIWDKIVTNLRFPIAYASLVMLVILTYNDPMTIVRLMFAMGLISFFNMLYYLHSEHSWDFVYGIIYAYFSFFSLFWLFPYAAMTLRSRSWMTR
ncbi:MAG: glycosyltransferase [Smithellaceae bacterium]